MYDLRHDGTHTRFCETKLKVLFSLQRETLQMYPFSCLAENRRKSCPWKMRMGSKVNKACWISSRYSYSNMSYDIYVACCSDEYGYDIFGFWTSLSNISTYSTIVLMWHQCSVETVTQLEKLQCKHFWYEKYDFYDNIWHWMGKGEIKICKKFHFASYPLSTYKKLRRETSVIWLRVTYCCFLS